MEYSRRNSTQPNKFKALLSARACFKITIAAFWDCDNILQIEFLERDWTINYEKYANTLTNQKQRARTIRPDKVPVSNKYGILKKFDFH